MPARVGDSAISISPCILGTCGPCAHVWSGQITSGSGNVFINGIAAARQGDQGETLCPHGGVFEIISGSLDVMNEQGFARVSDLVQCQSCGSIGQIVAGSTNVFVNSL